MLSAAAAGSTISINGKLLRGDKRGCKNSWTGLNRIILNYPQPQFSQVWHCSELRGSPAPMRRSPYLFATLLTAPANTPPAHAGAS